MEQYFVTKVFGFDPETYPVLGFTSPGARNNFLRNARPDHWVVYAGTKGEETSEGYRGRLLGKVRVALDTHVDVLEVLRSIGYKIPSTHWNEDGSYRWAYGLPMVRAERFVECPDTRDVMGSYLPGPQWSAYALDVEQKVGVSAAAALDAIGGVPVSLPESSMLSRLSRDHQATLSKTGPPPSVERSASRRATTRAQVYLAELRGGPKDVYKIGFSTDVERRMRELNSGLVTSVTGLRWWPIELRGFESEREAYDWEQTLHGSLASMRAVGETEVYVGCVDEVLSVWRTAH